MPYREDEIDSAQAKGGKNVGPVPRRKRGESGELARNFQVVSCFVEGDLRQIRARALQCRQEFIHLGVCYALHEGGDVGVDRGGSRPGLFSPGEPRVGGGEREVR